LFNEHLLRPITNGTTYLRNFMMDVIDQQNALVNVIIIIFMSFNCTIMYKEHE